MEIRCLNPQQNDKDKAQQPQQPRHNSPNKGQERDIARDIGRGQGGQGQGQGQGSLRQPGSQNPGQKNPNQGGRQ